LELLGKLFEGPLVEFTALKEGLHGGGLLPLAWGQPFGANPGEPNPGVASRHGFKWEILPTLGALGGLGPGGTSSNLSPKAKFGFSRIRGQRNFAKNGNLSPGYTLSPGF